MGSVSVVELLGEHCCVVRMSDDVCMFEERCCMKSVGNGNVSVCNCALLIICVTLLSLLLVFPGWWYGMAHIQQFNSGEGDSRFHPSVHVG